MAGADFDLAALERYLEAHVQGFHGPIDLGFIEGGQSNPTFHVRTPGARYVLRKKPSGVLVPSAHAVDREFRVLKALSETDVPVPPVVVLCEDESVIGTPFYVMRFVPGRTLWDPALPGLTSDVRGTMYEDLNRVLAAIHRVELGKTNLESYGRPGNYFERQVARWTKQYRATDVYRVPTMDLLADWLAAHLPTVAAGAGGDETALNHGDYRIDNVLFHPTEPRVVAVLDWELSTLGHPLADLAYTVMTWRFASGEFRGMSDRDLPALGIPTEAEWVAAYCRRVGRPLPSPELWSFAVACSMFRLAAILHGIALRAIQGTAKASNAVETGKRAQLIADIAWKEVQTAEGR
jgi:aminoglycoside phosphotransferase (APT) family kinase protein